MRFGLQLDDNIEYYFLSSPEGLGYENAHNYASVGDGFFRRIETKFSQQTINGTIIAIPLASMAYANRNDRILGQIYYEYRHLFENIELGTKIYLLYDPYGYGTNEYRREIEILSVSKSEITTNTVLEIPVSFKCLTPWYLDSGSGIEVISDFDSVMRYTYKYDDELRYGDTKVSTRAIITNSGTMPAALIVRINGVKRPNTAFKSPMITLIDSETAEIIGRCQVGIDLYKQETLEISSIPLDSYIKKISLDGTEEDLIDYIDISYDPFFRVPPGKKCELIIESASDSVSDYNSTIMRPESVEVVAYYYTRVV